MFRSLVPVHFGAGVLQVCLFGAERSDELSREDREVTRSRCRLFDNQRPASEPGVRLMVSGVGNTARPNIWSQIVSAKPRLTSCGPSNSVVDAVVVGADEDPPERAEPQVRVRGRERDNAGVE